MDFKKRVIEELGMTGHASSHLWDGYVDICEKIAKEYHNEQLNLPLVVGQSEQLKALLLKVIEEFDNGEVSWETRDEIEGEIKSL